mmetsp:Transcript_22319/g.40533  ORF Transcript_22319/g.40533 Transcript_22319/m.40533 type:complete len:320 (-) Transcript_22319:856-1815(-)
MSSVDTNTGEPLEQGRSQRFSYWVAFLVFSTITLGSAVQEKNRYEGSDADAIKNQKWAVACSAVTFAFTTIMVVLQLHPITSLFVVGTRIEGILCILLLAFWAATVAIVSDASHGLAVNENGEVQNGNLYYFSWAGFVTSILLTVSYLRGVFGVDVAGEMQNRSARLTTWAGLLASSLIVLGACANIFDQDCSPQVESDSFCQRTKYGLSLGAVATTFSLAVVVLKIATTAAPFVVEGIFSFILTVMYGFGVAFITGAKGPGSAIGNLYYFTWIGFLCCFVLLANCYEEFRGIKSPNGEHSAGEASNGDIQVDAIDDTI